MDELVKLVANRTKATGAVMLLAAAAWVFSLIVMAGLPLVPGSSALAGEPIVICTDGGLKTITLDANGDPVDAPSQSAECPWCAQLGGIGQIPGPGGVVAMVPARLADLNTCPARSPILADASSDVFDSRAPPTLARL